MPLEEYLFPKEVIKYTSTEGVRLEKDDPTKYRFYITNMRIILYGRRGLILKREQMISERLPDIGNITYRERGFFKKAEVQIETPGKKINISGKPHNLKAIYRELQKYVKPAEEEIEPLIPVKEIKEIITREVVMLPCEFCGTLMLQTATSCPNCGARKK